MINAITIRRSRVSITIAMLCALSPRAFSQVPSREEMVESLASWQEPIREQFFVHYRVDQKRIGEAEKFATLHVGDNLMHEQRTNDWSSIHAWHRAKSQFYHHTAPEADGAARPIRRGIISDGDNIYKVWDKHTLVHVTRKLDIDHLPKTRTPQEDLYRQMLGMESIRKGWGVTLMGNAWQWSYEATDAVASSAYQLSTKRDAGQARVIVENPGVDRIELLPEKNYAIVARTTYWKPPQSGIRTQFEVSRFTQLDDHTWVPLQASIDYYSRPDGNEVTVETLLQVEDVSLSPDPEYFRLQVEAFRGFIDLDRNDAVRMEPLEGRTIRQLLDQASDRGAAGGPPVATFLIVGLNILIALVVIALWMRRRKAAQS